MGRSTSFSIRFKYIQWRAQEQGLVLHNKAYYQLLTLLRSGAYTKKWERNGVVCLHTIVDMIGVLLYVSGRQVVDIFVLHQKFQVGDIVEYTARKFNGMKTGNVREGEIVYILQPTEDIREVAKTLPLNNYAKRNILNKKMGVSSHLRYIVRVYDEKIDRQRYALPTVYDVKLIVRPDKNES